MSDLRAALLRYRAKHTWACTSSTLGPDPRCECGLSDLLAATPEPTLDEAWAEAEAALPDAWWEIGYIVKNADSVWEARAQEVIGGGTCITLDALGPTPPAALRDLAARLHERTEPQEPGS